jgi:hypothetical protein
VQRKGNPPPGREAEEVEQRLGDPGTGDAGLVRRRVAVAAEEGAGVAAVVGGECQREVGADGEEEEPSRFPQYAREAG